MIWLCLLLLAFGLFLSAFFSGSETGFYRVARTRLAMDSMSGDFIARRLLDLTNHPALFVATTLVGNNLANYMVSLSIVLLARTLLGDAQIVELIAPVAMTPVVFVYGELLPKNLFYHAPNLLLHRCGPLFLLFVILFAPVSALLWAFGKLLELIVGESPQHVRHELARQELIQVLREGHEVGILQPAQQVLAKNLFAVASQRVSKYATPISRAGKLVLGQSRLEALRFGKRRKLSAAVVTDGQGELVGYVRMIDLYLNHSAVIEQQHLSTLGQVNASDSHGVSLMHMESNKHELAQVLDAKGATIGVLSIAQLTAPLFSRLPH